MLKHAKFSKILTCGQLNCLRHDTIRKPFKNWKLKIALKRNGTHAIWLFYSIFYKLGEAEAWLLPTFTDYLVLYFRCWKSNYRGLAASFTIWNHFAPEIVRLLDNSLALQCFTLSINSRPSSKLPPCFFLKRHNKQSPACVHDFQGRVAFGVPSEKLGSLPSWVLSLPPSTVVCNNTLLFLYNKGAIQIWWWYRNDRHFDYQAKRGEVKNRVANWRQ